MAVRGSGAQLLLYASSCRGGMVQSSRPIPGSKPVSPTEFRDFGHDFVYSTPDLLAMDGVDLSQRRKRIFAQKSRAYQNNFKLEWGKG